MKKVFTSILVLFAVISLNAQNLLSSLYNLDKFPKDMQKTKKMIDELCSDIVIYDFANRGNEGYRVNYEFELKAKEDVKVNLPFKNAISFILPTNTSNEKLKENRISIEYLFYFQRFYNEFEITKSTFSNASLFETAFKYYDFDEYELVSNTIIIYKKDVDYYTKIPVFFNELSTALGIQSKVKFDSVSQEDKETLTMNEIQEKMLNDLLSEYDKEDFVKVLFNNFILDKKSEEKTIKNIDDVLNRKNVIKNIKEEVLIPTIKVNFKKDVTLKLSEKLCITESDESLSFKLIQSKILFNEGCILIDFEMVKPVSVTIKDAVYKGEIVKNVSVKLNTIRLKLSDTKSEIHFIEYSRFNKNLEPYILSIR